MLTSLFDNTERDGAKTRPAHQLASDEHLDVGSLNAQLTRFDEID